MNNPVKRIGIVGYGKLGQFLCKQLLVDGHRFGLKLVFVWNRSSIQDSLLVDNSVSILSNLDNIQQWQDRVDLVVEVCHPSIVQQCAIDILNYSDILIGSPTAFAEQKFELALRQKLTSGQCSHRAFVARGALWGANDIASMAKRNLIQDVRITMSFHPRSLRLATEPSADQKLAQQEQRTIVFDGPARQLCLLAPNNVNTIATAALIGVGLDRTVGCLVADPCLSDYHRIEIEIGAKPVDDTGKRFTVHTVRSSPTNSAHNVTSLQTYQSFWHSILECTGKSQLFNNIHVC